MFHQEPAASLFASYLPECSIRDLARPFLQSHLHITELALIQLYIEPFLLQQFLMLAGLQNMSVLHNQNHIRFLDGGTDELCGGTPAVYH